MLGEGAFAKVKLAVKKRTGEAFAVKLVDKSTTLCEVLQQEVEVLQRCGKHRHIVSLVDYFDAHDSWALVMELVTGGEVFDRICEEGVYSEARAAIVLRQLGLALQHIHSRGIVHCDLKPENLLLLSPESSSDVKLCDFGLARLIDPDDGLTGAQGTVAYMAPELFSGEPFSKEIDLWGLGVIAYILLAGFHPFDPYGTADEAEFEKRIRSGEYSFDEEDWGSISTEARGLISALLEPRPEKRLTIEELLDHPWISGGRASTTALPAATTSKLRDFNDARRTWRAAIRAAALVYRSPVAASEAEGTGGARSSDGGGRGGPDLTTEALDELRDAFRAYDVDGSGSIDLDELRGVMRSLGAPDGEAERALKAADMTGNGLISFDEFCVAVGPLYDFSKAALRKAFELFDADKNGSLDEAEVRAMMRKLKLLSAGDGEADAFKRLFALADTNGDGKISFEEFVQLFRQEGKSQRRPAS
jgi:Ca2+-binding EF-hand superfamily protein/tRNA A-37 threonylcarbamoyl transferase component Bud32